MQCACTPVDALIMRMHSLAVECRARSCGFCNQAARRHFVLRRRCRRPPHSHRRVHVAADVLTYFWFKIYGTLFDFPLWLLTPFSLLKELPAYFSTENSNVGWNLIVTQGGKKLNYQIKFTVTIKIRQNFFYFSCHKLFKLKSLWFRKVP